MMLLRKLCLLTALTVAGCGPDEYIEGPTGRLVQYRERTEQGRELVDIYLDEDCLIRRLRGPTNDDLVGENFHCTGAELEIAEALLSNEAWEQYESVSWGGGGEGGADPGENRPQSKHPLNKDVDLPPDDNNPLCQRSCRLS